MSAKHLSSDRVRNDGERVVIILLRRGDITPEKHDDYRQTPLCWASWSVLKVVVEKLLGWGSINNEPERYSQTWRFLVMGTR